jgi:hypothetical protein
MDKYISGRLSKAAVFGHDPSLLFKCVQAEQCVVNTAGIHKVVGAWTLSPVAQKLNGSVVNDFILIREFGQQFV